jgi:hypothetical protein
VRHNRTRHADDPEEVRIEDRPGLFDRALFRSGGGDTEAGVVHEEVNATLQPHDVTDGSFDGFIAGHEPFGARLTPAEARAWWRLHAPA